MLRKVVLLAVLMGSALCISAQQTIFNVPTTDVLDRGKVYGELDASFKTNDSPAVNKFSSFVPRIVAGAGGNVEVGLNVTGNIQPGRDSTTLVPTIKYRFYQSKDKSVALIAGSNIYIPVRNRAYNIGSWSYLAVSKTIDKTRLTAGGYIATKNVFAANANRAGGQFGIEQTVTTKFTVAADWITGKHSAGYFTPGVIYKPRPSVTTYWGYSIGNTAASTGNHFFLFELGYNFN
ncbi:MAG TPA: hypothetical protein VGO43_03125 [Pyrinomonadaceae bacterium]|jgi:hypothetical protein|nr:hypothetical protein [Pyrinomonadaceae bacterium]